ncbi:MAG: metal ABC transporter permease [Rhizobiaceae bacterium]|nr:metal ABC transporter permease [Rhizobiaceae bacterium]
MFDDFFVRALLAGIGIAIIAGPLGCFVVWRRMAYFGDTIAHSALLGVALGYLLGINIELGVLVVGVAIALILLLLERDGRLPRDALLGVLSHSTLAIGLVMMALMSSQKVDLMHLLTGDILSVTKFDLAVIYGAGLLMLIGIYTIWRPLLAVTVNEELARAEGMRPEFARAAFLMLMALLIAIAIKIVGILLITSLLIIPAATARRLINSPEQMAFAASLIGVLAVCGGLFSSYQLDIPSGPAIVLAALVLFILSYLLSTMIKKRI